MIADLKPYPSCKDSGVQWLGEVPAHWEVRRLGRIGRLFKGGGGTKRDERESGIPCVRYGDLYTHHRSFITASRSCVSPEVAETSYTPLRYGDVLFAGSGETIDEIGKSAVNLIHGSACCGGDIVVFRPSIRTDARFLGYASDSPASSRQKACMGRGFTVMHIYSRDIKYMALALPPVPEQSAIARFLDHATDRIDRHIRAKEKLIALLHEYKQTLIHQAVTGQIDVRTGEPYPEYKASGVEWTGRVPRPWSVLQLGRITVDRCDGPFGSGLKSSHYTLDGIRVVRLQNIGHSEFKGADVAYIAPDHYATLGDHSVEPGDILIAGLGDERHPAGRACVAPDAIGPAMVKADCFRFRLDRKVAHAEFVALHLSATAAAATAALSTGATRQRINLKSTSSRLIPLPTMPEQLRIVEHTIRQTSAIRMAEQLAREEASLLRDYRSRLIADVVTGKLDVREAAAELPDTNAVALEDGVDTIQAESHSHRAERGIAEEANA